MKLALSSTSRHDRHCNSWVRLGSLSLLLFSVRAPAQPAQPTQSPAELCVAQAERAQEFHRAGDLARARAEVALCAQTHCPALVRNDCEAWLKEWDQPVAPAHANDESPKPIEKPRAPSAPAPIATSLSDASRADPERSSTAVWPWFSAAVGVAGVAGFTYWGLTGRREAEQLADGCGRDKSCTRAQVDTVRNKLIFADVSLGVGVLACGAAIVGFIVGATDQTPIDERATRRAPRVAPLEPTFAFDGSAVTARFVF